MCSVCAMDSAKAEGFAESLVDLINKGALSVMISIGHQTGLFDRMAELKKFTSQSLADYSGLNERYVREWLKAMAAGKIIEWSSEPAEFYFPSEHAAFLTRKHGSDNMALYTQYIPVLASVEQSILSCFYQGGGVPYSAYERFHEVMAEDSGQTILAPLLDQILPLIPDLTQKLATGIEVMDIGCGRGKAMIKLAENFPNSRFMGIDLCAEPLESAREEVRRKNLTNIQFKQADLTAFRPAGKFELITAFDAVHDQARPDLVLRTVYESLNDEGHFLMQDIDGSEHLEKNLEHPFSPLLYTISTMHCMSVSLAQGGLGLGTLWGVEMANRMLREAGFTQIRENRLPHDPMNCYFIVQK